MPPERTREAVIGDGITWLSRWSLRWVLLAAGAVLLGYVVQTLWIILLPLFLALILTTVLQPPALVLERRLGLPPSLAAATAIIGALAAITAVVLLIAPSVGSQLAEIANSASDGLARVERWVNQSDLDISQAQIESALSSAQDRLRESASSIATGVLVGVSAISSALVNLVLTLVLSFFLLKDGRRFLPWLAELTGQRVGRHLTEVGHRAWNTLGGFIRTQALVGLIDAVLIGLGLLVAGVPLAIPLAVLTFVGAFAPVIGAVVVGALAVLVALVSNGWVTALVILALVLLVQQLEGNLLLPWLQGRSLDLHAAVVLLTVVLGSALFGVAGAFLGVPVVAVAAVVVRYLSEIVDEHAAAPPGPEQTDQPGH